MHRAANTITSITHQSAVTSVSSFVVTAGESCSQAADAGFLLNKAQYFQVIQITIDIPHCIDDLYLKKEDDSILCNQYLFFRQK